MIFLSEAGQAEKVKSAMFSLICGIYLLQMQQYYEALATLGGDHAWEE
jgi:hypothetical protein